MTSSTDTGRARAGTAADGRSTRWEQHRLERRRSLVQAALRAIRAHGAGVGMEEMAAEAGTSKTVLYRHFGGRTGLYLAIVEHVDHQILGDLAHALNASDDGSADAAPTGSTPVTGLLSAVADGYLSLVERDPEIARFVITRPLADQPLDQDPLFTISARVAGVIETTLRERHADADIAPEAYGVWAHGLVGLVRGVSDAWVVSTPRRPRREVVADIIALADAMHTLQDPITKEDRS